MINLDELSGEGGSWGAESVTVKCSKKDCGADIPILSLSKTKTVNRFRGICPNCNQATFFGKKQLPDGMAERLNLELPEEGIQKIEPSGVIEPEPKEPGSEVKPEPGLELELEPEPKTRDLVGEVKALETETETEKGIEKPKHKLKLLSPEDMLVEEMADTLERKLRRVPGLSEDVIPSIIEEFRDDPLLQENDRELYGLIKSVAPKANNEMLNRALDTLLRIRYEWYRKQQRDTRQPKFTFRDPRLEGEEGRSHRTTMWDGTWGRDRDRGVDRERADPLWELGEWDRNRDRDRDRARDMEWGRERYPRSEYYPRYPPSDDGRRVEELEKTILKLREDLENLPKVFREALAKEKEKTQLQEVLEVTKGLSATIEALKNPAAGQQQVKVEDMVGSVVTKLAERGLGGGNTSTNIDALKVEAEILKQTRDHELNIRKLNDEHDEKMRWAKIVEDAIPKVGKSFAETVLGEEEEIKRENVKNEDSGVGEIPCPECKTPIMVPREAEKVTCVNCMKEFTVTAIS